MSPSVADELAALKWLLLLFLAENAGRRLGAAGYVFVYECGLSSAITAYIVFDRSAQPYGV